MNENERIKNAMYFINDANDFPYELSIGDNYTPRDWTHTAARAVISSLGERGGFSGLLADVHMDTRKEIISELANIICVAYVKDVGDKQRELAKNAFHERKIKTAHDIPD